MEVRVNTFAVELYNFETAINNKAQEEKEQVLTPLLALMCVC